MSRALIVLLCAAIGWITVRAAPPELRATELDCARPLPPDDGPVELHRCELDLTRARVTSSGRAIVPIGGKFAEWDTSDPAVVRAVARLPSNAAERERYLARHPDRATLLHDVVGSEVPFSGLRDGPRVFSDELELSRVVAATILPFVALGLLLLLRARRGWSRGAGRRPIGF